MNNDCLPGTNIFIKELNTAVTFSTAIPVGHKFAIRDIVKNDYIIKFGQIIGQATRKINKGEHVHVHNMKITDNVISFQNLSRVNLNDRDAISTEQAKTFKGYPRSDGRVGTRNYILAVATSNCSASVVRKICDNFLYNGISRKDIDGVVPLIYAGGCAQPEGGIKHTVSVKTIAGWVNHPNVVAAVVIGLGCEAVNINSIISNIDTTIAPIFIQNFVETYNIQEVGGTLNSIRIGIEKINKFLNQLPMLERVTQPLSSITIGLNCGGSDAFSAITANPALGVASDIIISNNGTSVLAEFPECHGAEKHLLERCNGSYNKKKFIEIIDFWKEYTKKNDVIMDNNLAPGNQEGGITTILEKSLGAIAKGGVSKINQVLDYAERITEKGLIFMNTPGFDPVSVTGLTAGGCNCIAFTTGRGSIYGCSIAPTIKIATNNYLFDAMKDDMDINAGKIIDGVDISTVGEEIVSKIISVASGEKSSSERNLIGWEEFVPWEIGAIL